MRVSAEISAISIGAEASIDIKNKKITTNVAFGVGMGISAEIVK